MLLEDTNFFSFGAIVFSPHTSSYFEEVKYSFLGLIFVMAAFDLDFSSLAASESISSMLFERERLAIPSKLMVKN